MNLNRPWLPWPKVYRGRRPTRFPKRELKLGGIVLDASGAKTIGDWTRSTWGEPYVGDGYLHDGNAGKGDKSIRFALGGANPGRYGSDRSSPVRTDEAPETGMDSDWDDDDF